MAIISQETFDKFTEEEKQNIRSHYEAFDEPMLISSYVDLFDKENLQSEPKIKTWKDMKEEYMLHADTGTSYIIDMDKNFYSEKLALKALATLQIAKLIELGYGGMVTNEEWEEHGAWQIIPYREAYDEKFKLKIVMDFQHKSFISFHNEEQAEEFISYPENRTLVKQYYMI